MLAISDLKRNDIAGAIAVYEDRKAAGTLYPSTVESLLMLQDDPDQLIAAIEKADPEASTRVSVPTIAFTHPG